MILVTVGSMFPFDRLIQAVDMLAAEALIDEPIYAQIGDGTYEPRHMPFGRFLGKDAFEARLASADAVISHAGIGTIATALAFGKPLLVLPRRRRYGEHVNDHQVATARKYEELGHVLVAWEEGDIAKRLQALRGFAPKPRVVNSRGLAERIGSFLSGQLEP